MKSVSQVDMPTRPTGRCPDGHPHPQRHRAPDDGLVAARARPGLGAGRRRLDRRGRHGRGTRRLLEQYASAGDGRVRTWVGLEHLMYCTPECFAQAVDLMHEFDTGLHTHSSETIWEVEESLKRWGRRPVEVFYDRGILGPRTVVAHCVWLSDREIEVLAQTGTSVAHCPASNMKLASGPARIGDLRRAGVHVGLGSDGEKENNNLDLIEEMKVASLLQKV